MERDVLKSGRGILVPRGHEVHQKQVRIRRTEHNKLDAGQVHERFFGLFALGNMNDEGQTRADEKRTLGAISFGVQMGHRHPT